VHVPAESTRQWSSYHKYNKFNCIRTITDVQNYKATFPQLTARQKLTNSGVIKKQGSEERYEGVGGRNS